MKAAERVGWNLRRLRVAKGISQDDLAYRANLDHAYIGYIERGKRNATLATLEKIATALDVDIAEFFVWVPFGAEEILPLKAGRIRRVPYKG